LAAMTIKKGRNKEMYGMNVFSGELKTLSQSSVMDAQEEKHQFLINKFVFCLLL